jgi:hypothetical protein
VAQFLLWGRVENALGKVRERNVGRRLPNTRRRVDDESIIFGVESKQSLGGLGECLALVGSVGEERKRLVDRLPSDRT